MGSTSIQWTDSVWNPVRGCSRVSRGCERCYAERIAARFSGPGQPFEGIAGSPRRYSLKDRFKRPDALPSVQRHRCLSHRATGTKAIYYLTVEYPEVPA